MGFFAADSGTENIEGSITMKKRIYLAMLVACFALTATACSDRGAVVTDDTKAEKQQRVRKQKQEAPDLSQLTMWINILRWESTRGLFWITQ